MELDFLLMLHPETPIPHQWRPRHVAPSKCGECGEELVLTYDGKTITLRDTAGRVCPNPEGMPEYTFEIPVPSGRLVVTDNLFNFFPDVEPRIHDSCKYNTGCRQISEACASLGLAHGMVGNTCPGVYRHPSDKYTVSVGGYDPNLEEENGYDPNLEEENYIEPPKEYLARIGTDLWWYCMADEDMLKGRGYKGGEDVIVVKPGWYRFTHRYHQVRDLPRPSDFATFEWVRE